MNKFFQIINRVVLWFKRATGGGNSLVETPPAIFPDDWLGIQTIIEAPRDKFPDDWQGMMTLEEYLLPRRDEKTKAA